MDWLWRWLACRPANPFWLWVAPLNRCVDWIEWKRGRRRFARFPKSSSLFEWVCFLLSSPLDIASSFFSLLIQTPISCFSSEFSGLQPWTWSLLLWAATGPFISLVCRWPLWTLPLTVWADLILYMYIYIYIHTYLYIYSTRTAILLGNPNQHSR